MKPKQEIMPGKRFSVTGLEAAGAGDGTRNALIAIVRQWASAFWAFEGLRGSLCILELNHFHNCDRESNQHGSFNKSSFLRELPC